MTLKTRLIIISILSILAFLNAFYLGYDWLFPIEASSQLYFQVGNVIQEGGSLCDINDTFSCTKVANSEFSKVFGIPFAIYAMLMFFIVFLGTIYGLLKNKELSLKLITIPSGVGALVNFYLFYLEIFVIKAFCPVCILISILLFSIFFISLYSTLKCTTKQ